MCQSSIELFDKRNVLRAKLSLEGDDENPRLSFFDKNGEEVFVLGIGEGDCCWSHFVNPKTKDVAGLGVSPEGPMLMLHSKGLFPAAIAYATPHRADIITCDQAGRETCRGCPCSNVSASVQNPEADVEN